MKQGSTLFLRFAIFIFGLIALAICLFGLPWAMMADGKGFLPVIFGLYLAALPFFVALHQALKLLHYIDTNQAFSGLSIKALQVIKYCAVAISGLFGMELAYIFYVGRDEDTPGIFLIGLFIVFASLVFATFAAVLQKLLQHGMEIKSENDLTV